MPRPQPTLLYHFTHVDNLASIVREGLLCDTAAPDHCLVDVGNRGIKEQRRRRPVPVGAGGMVADYVPFYFAPRSPMLYAVLGGQVEQYADGQDPLVYLVTTVERLLELGHQPIYTDRNASHASRLVRFSADVDELDELVDWPLMKAKFWHDTPDDPDRRARRMAECLVHQRVPWIAITRVAASARMRQTVETALAAAGAPARVEARPGWYF